MVAREYIIAFMQPPLPPGDVFLAWPLHMTLVPWFSIPEDVSLETATALLAAKMAKHRPLVVSALRRAKFGPSNNVAVTELEKTDELQNLHNSLVGLVESQGWDIAAKKYTKNNFRPHITDRKHAHIQPGSSVNINELWFVEAPIADPRTRQKTIITKFTLGGDNG